VSDDAAPVGVILAAGEGVRMAPLSAEWPKPLLPVLNRPVVDHQLALMRSVGVREVVVVVKEGAAELRAHLGDGAAHGVYVRYAEQTAPQGIAHAVLAAEPLVGDRALLLMLGDIYFVADRFERMLSMHREGFGAVLAAREEPDLEALQRNYAIVRAPDGRVARVIEKPRHPPTRLKGCGVYLFRPAFFDAIRRTPRSALRDEYEITDAIQIFIDDGQRVGVAEVVVRDVNLTVPRDLWALNLSELEREGIEALVDPGARVDERAAIVRSTVSRGASIGPVRVERSVVLGGARVERDTVGCIVTETERVALEEP
jgi:dTDP-glucose pyrophosphorylase